MKFLDQIRGITQQIQGEPKDMWSEIIGHQEIKEAFDIYLESKENSAVLMIGPPACSKSLFMDAIEREYGDEVCKIDGGGNASGAGTVEELLDRGKTTHLVVDEVDGLKTSDQKCLLVLLQSGRLKINKIRRKGMNNERYFKSLKVFMACNNRDRLLPALMSRCTVIQFKEYTDEEFIEIATKMFPRKDPVLCEYVARAVLKILGSRDIRDYVNIIKHSKNSDVADKLISLRVKYAVPKEEAEE
jgi:DNA polymerase III delta prime subunit